VRRESRSPPKLCNPLLCRGLILCSGDLLSQTIEAGSPSGRPEVEGQPEPYTRTVSLTMTERCCTEHDKMLAGEIYDTLDPELTARRKRARSLTRQFNESTEEEGERRAAIMHELFAAVGDSVGIEPPFRCDYGSHISIGTGTFINFDCVILDCHWVTIGKHVLIGPRVQIYAATHPLEWAERIKGPMMGRPVVIGDHVWVGGGAIICPGVTVGENAVIAAGSVVAQDVPPNVLVAGNPARVIREL